MTTSLPTPALTLPLRLEPRLAARVWGGDRLGAPQNGVPIGESWVLHEDSRIQGGPFQGMTLKELTARFPEEVLGHGQAGRFPLLIKLLDCHEWLSVQVHPNDQQAEQLVGPGELGKTEAWYILEAAPDAQLIAGVKEGTSEQALSEAILAGNVMDDVQYQQVQAGDAVFMPAGTLHALGPGLFLYEVQQTSDTTYRIYDWNRPASAGRELHLQQGATVTTAQPAELTHGTALAAGESRERIHCEYFTLEELRGSAAPLVLDTAQQSFHALTVIEGEGKLRVGNQEFDLALLETWLLPAALGAYSLVGESLKVLVARAG